VSGRKHFSGTAGDKNIFARLGFMVFQTLDGHRAWRGSDSGQALMDETAEPPDAWDCGGQRAGRISAY
jgi:hypothetical protein